MVIVFILLFLSLSVSFYLLFCDLLHLPSIASTKAALKLTQKKKNISLESITIDLAAHLSKHIHLDPYRRRTMVATLKYADIALTPETYLSQAIVKFILQLLIAIPFLFLIPYVAPIIVLWAINNFWDGTKKAEKIVAGKRAKIDEELPRFVSTIAQELKASRDVLTMLEGYRASAGELFRNELDITIADMKSGSAEKALSNLSGRVGSAMLSQVVRGLLGVLLGDNGEVYFSLLSYEFQNIESQNIEKEVMKRPGQMTKYSLLIAFSFGLTILYIIYTQLFASLSAFS